MDNETKQGIPKLSWGQHIKLIRYILGLIYNKHRFYVIFFSLSLILSALIPVASIWVAKLIFVELGLFLQQAGSMHRLLSLIALEIGFIFSQRLFENFTNYMNSRFSQFFCLDMQTLLLANNNTIAYANFETNTFYNKFKLSSSQTVDSASTYLRIVINVVRAIIQMVSISFLIALVDMWFLAAIVILNIINFGISMAMANRQYGLTEATVSRSRFIEYIYHTATNLKSIRDLKLNNLFPNLISQLRRKSEKNIHLKLDLERKEMKTLFAFEFITTAIYYGFYIYIIVQVAQRILTIGDIALFQRSYNTLNGALSSITNSITGLYEKNLYLHLFYDLIHNEEYKELESGIVLNEPIQKISINNIVFSYPSHPDKNIIKNDNPIQLNSGELVGIVGQNGTGKSTLTKLLSGLFFPTEGEIYINNTNITQPQPNKYRNRISTLLQDCNQYELSLLYNITGSENAIDQQRLNYVIKTCQLNTIIDKLDNGLATKLSRQYDDGALLSSGQWQKIALARALYRQADVLILDEPTAHLDTKFTHYFFDLLPSLKKEYNIIIIVTHKLQFSSLFNQLLFIDTTGCFYTKTLNDQSQLDANDRHFILNQ